jgi:hypothetical protein
MWFWFSALCVTSLVGFGSYLGYVYHDNIQGILKVQHTFAKEKRLRNTVLPESLSAYIPEWALSWLETGKFIAEHVWCVIEQSLLGSCVPLDEAQTVYRVRFMIHHKLYHLVVRPVSGPIDMTVLNSVEEDISDQVTPYILGAKSVVQTLTPKLLLKQSEPVYVFSMHDPATPLRIEAEQCFPL